MEAEGAIHGFRSVTPRHRQHGATVLERLVSLLPLPYGLSALMISASFGVPGFIVARYLDTGSVNRALSLFSLNLPSVATYSLATFGLTLYALLGIRFMRSRTREAQKALVPLLPGGSETFEQAFAPVINSLPPLALTPVLLIVSFAAFPDQVHDVTGPCYLVLRALGFPIAYFAYASFIWVYLSSIWSLHVLGRGRLVLPSYLGHPHFGLKPFGSLSLALATVYFVGRVLVGFSFLSLPPLFVGLLAALALPGVILFFLPLLALHNRMVEEGRKAEAALAAAYTSAGAFLSAGEPEQARSDPEAVRRLLALQILEHRVSLLCRWPLDQRTMSAFSAIVVSVVAAIATRYVLTPLGV